LKFALKEGPDMATQRIVLNLLVAVGSTVVAQNAAVAQEHRGTWEQQMACTPDVFRLCGAQIPDENRIVACLRQNTVLLSGPCRAVFESNASVPQSPSNARVQQAQPVAPGRRAAPLPIAPSPSADDDDNQ
jgi:hypothetical protein